MRLDQSAGAVAEVAGERWMDADHRRRGHGIADLVRDILSPFRTGLT